MGAAGASRRRPRRARARRALALRSAPARTPGPALARALRSGPARIPGLLLILAAAAAGSACSGATGTDATQPAGPATSGPPVVAFTLDEAAFVAPVAPAVTPFDIVAADMDLDGDPDVLINWHNLARLELFENDGGSLRLRNERGDDHSGLFDNPGIPDIYGDEGRMMARAREAGTPGVFIWHDPNGREDWNFYVVPAAAPARLRLRGNEALTPRLDTRFIRSAGEREVDLEIPEPLHFRVNVAFVSTELKVAASLPLYVGPQMVRIESGEVDLWKDDPHGIAWVDVRGTPEPDLFITRGGLMGTLQPPLDPKIDRFFEYTGGDPLYRDVRDEVPAGYGRGRRLEWVDVDGDLRPELYIGNTDTPDVLLSAAVGGYRDVAPERGLDFDAGDTFAWLDVDGDGRDDLVFVDGGGFEIAYNRAGRFDVRPGAAAGLLFPAGAEPLQGELFASLALYVLDYNDDGRLDLWLIGHGAEHRQALYRGGEAGFTDVTAAAGLDGATAINGLVILDVDNDGYLDAVALGIGARLFHNQGGRRFATRELAADWALPVFTRGVAADVDGDGLLDILLAADRRLLARNASTGAGGALLVLPRAGGADPVGTTVTAFYADGRVQVQRYGSAAATKYSQGSLPLHFGNPAAAPIERIVVRWPDGATETREVGAGDELIEVRHPGR